MSSRRAIAACLACLALGVSANAGARTPLVGILSGSSAAPYQQARDGAREALERQGIAVQVALVQTPEEVRAEVTRLRAAGASVIITLGAGPTHDAAPSEELPVVAGMVLDQRSLSGRHMTGVTLSIPIERQLEIVRSLAAGLRRVGVIWGDESNRESIASAEPVAKRLGLQLEVRQVASPRDIPHALESLRSSADVIWGLPDALVLTPQTAPHVLLYAYRNRLPFIAPAANWARAGAFGAFDFDYKDLGAQCAELAHQIALGRAPATLPPQPPRKVQYALNTKTAEYMRIALAADLLRGASQVFGQDAAPD